MTNTNIANNKGSKRVDLKKTLDFKKLAKEILYSEPNPVVTNFEEVAKRKKQLLEWQAKNGSKHSDKLRKFIDNFKLDINNPNASVAALEQLISNEIAEIAKTDKAEADDLQKIIDSTKKELEKAVASNDIEAKDMFKYRLLQLALIVTPFGPLTLLGPVVSAMMPFLQGADFAAFISSIFSTSGPLGKFATVTDALQFDVAVRWTMQVPLSPITDVVDVLFEFISPIAPDLVGVAGGYAPAIAIAVAYSAYRATPEYEHFKKFSDAKHKAIDGFYTKCGDNAKSYLKAKGAVAEKFSQELVQTFQKNFIEEQLALTISSWIENFTTEGKDSFLYLFQIDGKNPLIDIISKPDFDKSPAGILDFLNKNEAFKKSILDRAALIDEVMPQELGAATIENVTKALNEAIKDGSAAAKVASNNKRSATKISLMMSAHLGITDESGNILDEGVDFDDDKDGELKYINKRIVEVLASNEYPPKTSPSAAEVSPAKRTRVK